MDGHWLTHNMEIAEGTGLEQPLDREWLISNGTGAYAMGTAAGVNTRRYHGLLVAATHPPVGRVVALNQVVDGLCLYQGGSCREVPFAACAFHDAQGGTAYHPGGHAALRGFQRGLSVLWRYEWAGVTLTRELFLHWRAQAATLRYTVTGLRDAAQTACLSITPLLTLRDFHSLLQENESGGFDLTHTAGEMTAKRGDSAVTLSCPGGSFVPADDRDERWWRGFHYPRETDRGQDDREDAFLPGRFEVQLDPAEDQAVVSLHVSLGESAGGQGDGDADALTRERAAHLQPMCDVLMGRGSSSDGGRIGAAAGDGSGAGGAGGGTAVQQAGAAVADQEDAGVIREGLARQLAIAADDFVVQRSLKGKELSTVLAGYPWFADWGRDTFIALPGLLLETGRYGEARDVLRLFAEAIRGGLIPNRFDDYDDAAAHYNTVDAPLWFIHGAILYTKAANDRAAWDEWLAPAATSILDAYLRGTEHDIRMTGDGLISAGSPATQLTWMDAACNGVVFTPRHGKAVEINALWYNALTGVAELIENDDPRAATHYAKLAKRVNRSFTKVFWDEGRSCLIDHVWTDGEGNDHRDESFRANQVFVASLPRSPLALTRRKKLIKTIRDRLLTPYGLRTLEPDDPNFHPRYAGPPFDRDRSYHQGTVWPWLMGPYVEGVLRCGGFSDAARRHALEAVTPLLDFMEGPGLGQVHEVHDGDPPHSPGGCIAQAWSVAELVRSLVLIERGG